MTQLINPDQLELNHGDNINKDLSSGKDNLQITDTDDEDILKNKTPKHAVQEKPLAVAEFKEDMEDEDDLDEEAETSIVL